MFLDVCRRKNRTTPTNTWPLTTPVEISSPPGHFCDDWYGVSLLWGFPEWRGDTSFLQNVTLNLHVVFRPFRTRFKTQDTLTPTWGRTPVPKNIVIFPSAPIFVSNPSRTSGTQTGLPLTYDSKHNKSRDHSSVDPFRVTLRRNPTRPLEPSLSPPVVP